MSQWRGDPKFSVVVPTHGRPRQIGACLACLADLDYPKESYEIVVVDDGSPTPLDLSAASLPARPHVEVVRQRHSGPGSARNTGAKRARGRFLAFTDDDCLPAPDWLAALADAHERSPGAMIGGPVVNECEDNLYARVNSDLIDFVTEYLRTAGSELSFFTSNNLSAPRDRFLEIGGFNESNRLAAAEDRILSHDWNRRGWPAEFVSSVVVSHRHPQSLATFLSMHHRYGRGARIFHRLSGVGKPALSETLTIEFYGRMLRWPFVRHAPSEAMRVAVLMMCAQAAEATGYFREVVASRPSSATAEKASGDRDEWCL
jgi:glycosyltransferase involved in cell wall biosynthesis